MTAIKKRIVALESRLSKPATIEDIIEAVNNEKMGIEVPEKEWQRIRNSRAYKLMESFAIKEQHNKKSE